jgi:hemolysin III
MFDSAPARERLTAEEVANCITHGFGLAFSLAGLVALLLLACLHGGALHIMSSAIYGASLVILYLASTLYHGARTKRSKHFLQVVDHCCIYLLIAGTYTPVALLVMSSGWATPVLAIIWSGAGAAILLKVIWVRAPKWLAAAIALFLGWIGAAGFSQLLVLGPTGLALLVLGGLLYSAGAIVYARRRPDPIPHLFGYHELFHLLTVAAAAAQYAAIAFFVLPRA